VGDDEHIAPDEEESPRRLRGYRPERLIARVSRRLTEAIEADELELEELMDSSSRGDVRRAAALMVCDELIAMHEGLLQHVRQRRADLLADGDPRT
jgi:hypothetical protein